MNPPKVTPLQQTLIILGTIYAVLAAAAYLAVATTTLTGTQAFGIVSIIAGGTAVAGGLTLAAPVPNTALIPHVLLILAVIAMTVALAVEKVWTGTEVMGTFSFILGGGVLGAGSTTVTNQLVAMAKYQNPPPPPAPLPPPEG